MTQTPVQPGIMDIALYVSGESTLAGRDDVLKLSSNENPLGPSPAAQDAFRKAADECQNCLDAKLPIPAYEQAIKASHVFNTLQARGVISVAERQAYIGRVRDLAKGACAAWMDYKGYAA